MALLDAIDEVLNEVGKSLHVSEIYKEITTRGLWNSSGKRPTATVSSQLYSDIKKHGFASRFVLVSPATFAVRGSSEVLVEKQSSLNFTACAQKVLEVLGEKKPMHYRDITTKALEKGWLVTKGKTPELTMNAQVNTEIKRRRNRGDAPRFVQHGRGYFGLSKWQARGLSYQIEQHNQEVRRKLRDRLLVMKPEMFEKLTSQLLAEMGFIDVEYGKYHADGGIDVRGELTVGDVVRLNLAVQVKRWKRNVQAQVVRDVRGSLGAHEQGLIITTSDFGKGAKEEAAQADKSPIALMNGEQLVQLLMEYGIGVHRSTPNLFEIDEESVAWNKE